MAVMKAYWPLVLDTLKKSLSKSMYDAWFSQVEFRSAANNGRKIVLAVPSKFNKNYLENKFKKDLKSAVQKYYPNVIHFEIEIDPTLLENQKAGFTQDQIFNTEENLKTNQPGNLKLVKNDNFKSAKNLHNLNPKYTFERLVENSSNQLAVKVSQSIIDQLGTLYNPVFIYSGVGLGKTHLLQAIGHKVLEKYPGKRIKYATCETFFNHFIQSIQTKTTSSFHDYYRSVDILLLDDIQFISGKEATQEAFFHAFNELHQQNKQIVIACDKHPKSLGSIESRLISRFEWGIVIDISQPGYEDRLAVLKKKVDEMNIPLTSDQVSLIASKAKTNFRDLEGVLNRLEARIRLIPNTPVEDYEIKKLVGGNELASTLRLTLNHSTIVGPQQILEATSNIFGITKDQILGRSRQKHIAEARQIAMYLCRNKLDLSFPAVAQIFDRDHTTILHANRKIEETLSLDTKTKKKIESIESLLS
jgi:chromosomal replication initiator protein